ncbi:MAG: amino acid decarboxylase, partial [Acidobacteria bacterium]|nr:amino acid decarboxylase [Acidobacteriota bacterium]
ELRALGHRMVDDMFTYLSSVRTRPAWQPVPQEIKEQLDEALPLGPTDAAEVYEEFKRNVLPYPAGNIHPRFWGWVKGTGTPLGMLADMLASGMNANVSGYDQSAALVEMQVIKWLAELLGMPRESGGLLVSGGTVANLVGLTVARNARAGFDVRERGLQHAAAQRLVLYASTETHSCAQKAIELLGLGNESLRRIPVNLDYQIELEALRRTVAADRAAGFKPFCVIGNAGTVNTGALDDLTALAAFCREEELWFHVDGAFGALAALAPGLKHLVAGMEEADSIAFDLHKWMYLPYEVGCILVRDERAQRAAFSLTPNYLKPTARGTAAGGLHLAELGVQLSRGFRALKVWMSLKTHGAEMFGRLIEQNVRQAGYLRELIEADARLELLAPVSLNVVCFRFRAAGLSETELNKLNEELLLRVQESGVAVPSSTLLGTSYALRVANTNHRSRRSDFELLVKTVAEIGEALLNS